MEQKKKRLTAIGVLGAGGVATCLLVRFNVAGRLAEEVGLYVVLFGSGLIATLLWVICLVRLRRHRRVASYPAFGSWMFTPLRHPLRSLLLSLATAGAVVAGMATLEPMNGAAGIYLRWSLTFVAAVAMLGVSWFLHRRQIRQLEKWIEELKNESAE